MIDLCGEGFSTSLNTAHAARAISAAETYPHKSFMSESSSRLRQETLRACRNGDIASVKACVEAGVDVNGDDCYLMYVTKWPEIVEYLLSKGASPFKKSLFGHFTASEYAEMQGHTASFALIERAKLPKETDSNKTSERFFEERMRNACLNGDIESVKKYVDAGADVNAMIKTGYTALQYAVMDHDLPDVVQFLLHRGADPTIRDVMGHTVMQYAVARERTKSVEVLKRFVEDRMRYACRGGDLESVKKYVQDGADVNGTIDGPFSLIPVFGVSTAGFTPLHLATTHGDFPDVVQFLLDRGADPTKKTREGLIALHYAIRYGYDESITILKNATPAIQPSTPVVVRSTQTTTPRPASLSEERAFAIEAMKFMSPENRIAYAKSLRGSGISDSDLLECLY